MGQVLHGSARHDRGGPSHETASSREPEGAGEHHGINPKTVAKWKKRTSVQGERTGPKEPRSTVLKHAATAHDEDEGQESGGVTATTPGSSKFQAGGPAAVSVSLADAVFFSA